MAFVYSVTLRPGTKDRARHQEQLSLLEGQGPRWNPQPLPGLPRGEGCFPVARRRVPRLSGSHAGRALLPAVATPAGDVGSRPGLVSAPVVPGGTGLAALGVPAKQPRGLWDHPGLPQPLDGPGDEPHLPRGGLHAHHHHDAGDQPQGASDAALTGRRERASEGDHGHLQTPYTADPDLRPRHTPHRPAHAGRPAGPDPGPPAAPGHSAASANKGDSHLEWVTRHTPLSAWWPAGVGTA